jgi:hypothetical protein
MLTHKIERPNLPSSPLFAFIYFLVIARSPPAGGDEAISDYYRWVMGLLRRPAEPDLLAMTGWGLP